MHLVQRDVQIPVGWIENFVFDYVTKVKDHRWASNWITLEFEWTVQGCILREWRVVRKYGLFSFVFLHKCNHICVENLFI